MSASSSWFADNDAYLAGALEWLREVLSAEPATPTPPADAGEPGWWVWPESPPDGPPPALEHLAAVMGLSRLETGLLLLCAAMELDPTLPVRCAAASGDPGACYPTFGLALRVLPAPAWDVLSPYRPLRYWRLLEVHQLAGQPLITSALKADERIVNYIKGLNELDERLTYYLRPVAPMLAGPLPPTHEQLVEQVTQAWSQCEPSEQLPVVQLVGPDPVVRAGVAAEAAGRLGLELFELATDRLPTQGADIADLLRLWDREMLLRPLALFVDVSDLRPQEAPGVTAILNAASGPVITGCRDSWPLPQRRVTVLDADRPTAAEQELLWAGALGGPGADQARLGQAGELAAKMAGHFDLNQVAIAGASRSATSAPLDASKVWRAAQHLTRPRLDALAARIEPALSWDDLVLPAEQLTMLTHLVDQVRGRATVMGDWGFGQRGARGTGSTALFAGPSGTGKTLAAEVIAGELDLCLYRIDLSGIVSKYIGDTERNLRRVFDAAEEGGALLFFDEADALFGKRSEVRDSHDRYANIEVNYLLQRMEDYRGIAILATNQRSALDQAFLRRLRVVVTFPHPTRDDRAALWRRAFPPRTPTVGIDVERLAQLSATGGMIRNIALNAATCAAGRRSAVTMDMVLAMARMEFVKLELPVNEQDFADVGVGAR